MENKVQKVWQIIGVTVLCAVCVLGAVLGVLFGVKNPNAEIIPSTDMSDKPDDSVIIDKDSEQGISLLMGAATTAADGSTTQTITATVEPEDSLAFDKLNWFISFKNKDSEWAKGKTVTDYVNLSVSSDTSVCTLTCDKAFGEQIVINVYSSSHSASASLTVDYVKRITSYVVGFWDENVECYGFGSSGTDDLTQFYLSWRYQLEVSLRFSDGTITGDWYVDIGGKKILRQSEYVDFSDGSVEWTTGPVEIKFYYNNSIVRTYKGAKLVGNVNSISLSGNSIMF